MTAGSEPVALVSMPTLASYVPSFQLALLAPTLERAGIAVEPHSLFLQFGRRIGWQLNDVLAMVHPCMLGEWVWAKAAFGSTVDDAGYFRRYKSSLETICGQAECDLDEIVRVRDEEAPAFVEWAMEEVDWSRYALVGFTVVFQQMVASLALAKAIKRAHAEVPIIFGGATFEDDIAAEVLHRNPEVDFVHCGDADLTFPEVVGRVTRGETMRGVPGLMWRDGDVVRYEGRAPNLEDLDRTPVPDFDEYFHTRAVTGAATAPKGGEVMLPIETARGCWYGMKRHCTFCGLNRAGMEFRRKDPEQVLKMLGTLSRRYGTRWFNAIDNILAPAYVSRLFGRLEEARTDLRLHYEVRPTLTRPQLGAMRRGGLVSVQPGIESFSSHVLDLMRKGTTGMQNLELLKWTTYYGINNLYNILFGFPGETGEDYKLQAQVIRLIPHLQPPYAMAQARPDRGSPMFEQPGEHSITLLRPSACYRHIYPAGYDLRRIAYFFEHEMADALPDSAYDECFALVADWSRRWKSRDHPYLTYVKTWDSVSIHDGRRGAARGRRLDGDQAALFEVCLDARKPDELAARLDVGGEWLERTLAELTDEGLLAALDGRYLALALPENPYH